MTRDKYGYPEEIFRAHRRAQKDYRDDRLFNAITKTLVFAAIAGIVWVAIR